MTTQSTKEEPEKTLEQAVDGAVAEVTEVQQEPGQPEKPLRYATLDEIERRVQDGVARETERLARHFQSVTDKTIAKQEGRVKALEEHIRQQSIRNEDAYLNSLPEQERPAAKANLAYDKVRKMEQDNAQAPPEEPQVASNDGDVVAEVQRQAQTIATELGVNFYDLRVWQGLDVSLSVQDNLNLFRQNANRLKPASSTAPKPQTSNPPQSQGTRRQPETVPSRPSPAAGTAQRTDDEIQDWLIREPNSQQAQKAYREMRNRWAG